MGTEYNFLDLACKQAFEIITKNTKFLSLSNLRLALVLANFQLEKVATIPLESRTHLLDVMVQNLSDDRNKVRRISLHFLELVMQKMDDAVLNQLGYTVDNIRKLFLDACDSAENCELVGSLETTFASERELSEF